MLQAQEDVWRSCHAEQHSPWVPAGPYSSWAVLPSGPTSRLLKALDEAYQPSEPFS